MSGALSLPWRRASSPLLVAVVALLLHAPAAAAEQTEPEKMYERLKEAEKHADRLLGDRWNKLVRQRQWTDSSGKFKTYARYVDHDADLQSVKLLILVKKGDSQTYKEATIPLAKLSKTDQAIVKRIAGLRTQVEEALADAPASDAASGEATYAEGAPFDPSEPPAEAALDVPPPPAHLATMAAIEPWRTDFIAFSNGLSPQQDEQGQWAVSWPALPQFDAVYQQEKMIHYLKNASAGFPAAALAAGVPPQFGQAPQGGESAPVEAPAAPVEQPAEVQVVQAPPPVQGAGVPRSAMFMIGAKYGWARSGLGEVSWETTIQAAPEPDKPLQHDLQLSSPLTLELVPDRSAAAEFARVKPGERIRFVGRFERLGGLDNPPKIVLKVRPVPKTDAAASDQTRELYGRSVSP
jgi:hypothetical protein